MTPALALTPPPVGWYDQQDGERNFAQQVQFTPFTSFVNVAGLPAITVPVEETRRRACRWACSSSAGPAARRRSSPSPRSSSVGCGAGTGIRRTGESAARCV